jgi:hypothetical protein
MPPSVLRRSALIVVLSVVAFAAGALSVTLMAPRVAHADAVSSAILVPWEGLTFRSVDGRAIARLSYSAGGGVFEVLDGSGNSFATGRVPPLPSPSPSASPSATSSENLAEDAIPLRSPQTRRKVRLERNNPWP